MCLDKPDPEAPKALRTFIRSKQDAALSRTTFKDYFERDDISALVLAVHPAPAVERPRFPAEAVSNQTRGDVAAVLTEPGAPWAGAGIYLQRGRPGHDQGRGSARTIRATAATQRRVRGDRRRRDPLPALPLGRAGADPARVPLMCGVTWSMALTQIVLGRLNAITSLISTVVVGMGIDAGIHFLVRVREEQSRGSDREAITPRLRQPDRPAC